MKQLDYGKGYQYAHDQAEGVADMDCLPERLRGRALLPARPSADSRRRSSGGWTAGRN